MSLCGSCRQSTPPDPSLGSNRHDSRPSAKGLRCDLFGLTEGRKVITRILSPRATGLVLVIPLFLGATAVNGDESALLSKSREITAQYATEMQAALQSAMAAGGPVGAISACSEVAPEIAARLSVETGATVSRTSLRVRNPDNAPDEWQSRMLEQMNQDSSVREAFETSEDGRFRYLKAIPTGGLCLNCHGTVLSPDIQSAIDQAYPDDKATGYYLDDVRGAFSIVWPSAE